MNGDTNASIPGLPPSALSAIHQAVAMGRSAEEAARTARRVGFGAGADFLRAFQTQLDAAGAGPAADLEVSEFWDRVADFFAGAGWGHLEFDEPHPGVVMLSAPDWAEAEGRRSKHPGCHVTTGLLGSLVNEIAGARLAVLETECRCAGADRCTFLIGGSGALETIYAVIREGRPHEQAVAALG